VMVDVPEMNFLMVDGAGDPNTSQEYQESIEVLYAMSYTLKFMVKKEDPEHDYTVMPLEGLWWAEDMDLFLVGDKGSWKWTSMIMQPEFVTEKRVSEAVEQVKAKKDPMALPKCRFEAFHEGQASRDIPGRSHEDGAREAQDDHKAAREIAKSLRDAELSQTEGLRMVSS